MLAGREAIYPVAGLVGKRPVSQPGAIALCILDLPAVQVDLVLSDADAVIVQVVGLDDIGEDQPSAVLVEAFVPRQRFLSPMARRRRGSPVTVTGSLKVTATTTSSR